MLEKYQKIIEIEEGKFAVNLAGLWLKEKTEKDDWYDDSAKYISTDTPYTYSKEECFNLLEDSHRINFEKYCPLLGVPVFNFDRSEVEIVYLDGK